MLTEDFWGERPTRTLWVANAEIVLYALIREHNRQRKKSHAPSKHVTVLRIGCDYGKEEKLRREREAKKSTALSTETRQPRVCSMISSEGCNLHLMVQNDDRNLMCRFGMFM